MKHQAFFEGRQPLTTQEKSDRISELRQEIDDLEAVVLTAQLNDPEAVDQMQAEETRMALLHLKEELLLLEESSTDDGATATKERSVLSEADLNFDLTELSTEELHEEIARLQSLVIVHKSSDAEETHRLQARIEAARKVLEG